ncbi:MAG: TraB/GumN family protein [Bacteroidales bacterium]|nr:TraB/GumN family protein [Bacteroidales bacterium]
MVKNNILSGVFLTLTVLISQQTNSQSLLWKITGNTLSSPSYLYGTIHIKDKRVFEWQDPVYARLGECSAYAGELDLNMDNIMKAAGYMLLPEGQTLHDRFTTEEYNLVKDAVKSCSGYELALLDKLKPISLVALCFSVNGTEELEATVDELLYKKAVEGGKQIIGLETVEEQVVLLDKIPDSYVLEYFRNLDEQEREFNNLIRFYRNADLDSLWLMMQDEESGSMLNDEMIRARNHRMTERIMPLIRKQSTFIAVGSGHLPGNEGIIALLRNEGYVVEPERIVW